jgi:hypothetical protein
MSSAALAPDSTPSFMTSNEDASQSLAQLALKREREKKDTAVLNC